jgi:calcium-dependent protein kinase
VEDFKNSQVDAIFKRFDTDNDGRLGKNDIKGAFKLLQGEEGKKLSDEEIKMIVDKADQNGDGFIDITEWHAVALSHRKSISENNLKWAFKFFDDDNCNCIDAGHFKRALKISDEEFDLSYWNSLIS